MNCYSHIRDWISDLPKVGRLSFSLGEVREQFPNMTAMNVQNALYRVSKSGQIRSVWRGYYALVRPEYGFEGSIPPTEYIGQLMNFIGVDYYIALLSAASYQGASHQSPQVFQTICNKQLRSKTVSNIRLEFIYKRNMPTICIEQKAVMSGIVNVSAPALTALDLVSYHTRSGNLSNVASVLSELAENIDFNILDDGLLKNTKLSAVQRLGYLLEHTLDETELANMLYDKCLHAQLQFVRTDLAFDRKNKTVGYDKKWMLAINYDVEVDA